MASAELLEVSLAEFFSIYLITDFKTVGLCLEKIPNNIRQRYDWKPNHHKMRDLMTTAMVANEQQMKKSQERQNRMIERGYHNGNAPNASERTHVGSKTPVLGSMDLVTGNLILQDCLSRRLWLMLKIQIFHLWTMQCKN
jgi:hypothetical protein